MVLGVGVIGGGEVGGGEALVHVAFEISNGGEFRLGVPVLVALKIKFGDGGADFHQLLNIGG